MKKIHLVLLLLIAAISACNAQPTDITTEDAVTPTATLPDPQVRITPAPDVDDAVDAFMTAWQSEDYAAMYGMVSAEVRNTISQEQFANRYLDTAAQLTLQFDSGIEYDLITTMVNPDDAQASLQVNYNTYLFGTFNRQIELPLVREGGGWFVQWDDGMIMPELRGGNVLEVVRQTTSRGDIFASDGSPIAAQEDVVAIGFTPGGLNEDLMGLFYTTMARLTIYQSDEIVEMVENSLPGDYIPLGEVPESEVDQNMSALSALSGVFLNYYSSRFYYDGGIAPQAVGHLTYISEEEQYDYLRRGYSINERFGSTGLERAYEDVLSGERGASLYLKDANGQILSKLAEKAASSGQSITTTIDARLQYLLQQSLGNFRGGFSS